ncbi:WLM-domain-containing protein [Heliocybe sulcata]|uniref:WLM-domain-containing protein n=1 Tax=Heliocybe sulcata TaxID=5364 RepID=A0A5C3MSA9_9AGAM|nr:WLM-domain-containing protein [Heliocybe sulcata]
MVHHRINEREPNPNPHVNFIAVLPMPEPGAQEGARQLLRALAAQVRPIMKAHGFVVNSLEEYEYNRVFAGRNWEAGETVELVLRRADGSFYPNSWLLSTLCHEHMNHGPAFQALWRQLKSEVGSLQAKGYYGDGYWSSGQRLLDSATVGGQTMVAGDLPEYMCGGAQSRARPVRRRRRRTAAARPSNRTGAQSAKRRKAGSRVTAEGIFKGKGTALNEDIDDGSKTVGTGFRKKAARLVQERALAAERRLQGVSRRQYMKADTSHPKEEMEASDDEDDGELEVKPETDQQRRETMLESMNGSELEGLKTSAADFFKDFFLPAPPKTRSTGEKDPLDLIDLTSDNEPVPSSLSHVTSSKAGPSNIKPPGKISTTHSSSSKRQTLLGDSPSSRPSAQESRRGNQGRQLRLGNLVQDEVDLRKKESLGLALGGARNKLGATPSNAPHTHSPSRSSRAQVEVEEWACAMCTL